MARTRDLKPSFFKSEQIAACAPLTRVFFQGLWTEADRQGRLADRPAKLKAEILPYDNADGEMLLKELVANDLIFRYEVDGCKYIQILTFAKHQRVHPRETKSTIPPVPRSLEGAPKVSRRKAEPLARRAIPSSPSLSVCSEESSSPIPRRRRTRAPAEVPS